MAEWMAEKKGISYILLRVGVIFYELWPLPKTVKSSGTVRAPFDSLRIELNLCTHKKIYDLRLYAKRARHRFENFISI